VTFAQTRALRGAAVPALAGILGSVRLLISRYWHQAQMLGADAGLCRKKGRRSNRARRRREDPGDRLNETRSVWISAGWHESLPHRHEEHTEL